MDWSGASDPPIVDGLVKLFTPRTLRLLRNVDELEREVLDSNPSHGSRLSASQEDTNEAGIQLSDEELRQALQLARSAKLTVPRNNKTDEFYVACEEEDWGWKGFKEKCRNRRAWGEYFRSELDWDWDLAGSLKRMYKLPRISSKPSPGPTQHGESQFPSSCACPDSEPNPSTGTLKDGRLHVETVVDGPVNEVQVPVRSSTGEITYKTFFADPPQASGLSQHRADMLPEVKVHGASDPSPSINPIHLSGPTDSNSSNHLHGGTDHKQEPFGVEKATDEQLDTPRREDVCVDGSSFSEVYRATADDYASLYSFM